MSGADGFMSPAEVAARSGLSRKTVYRAIASGALVAYQPTSRYLIPERAYQAWITSERAAVVEDSHPVPRPVVVPPVGSGDELRAIESEAA
jgi:excisionase family DNA binding protein